MDDASKVFTYGCSDCGWEGRATQDEATAYRESEAHYEQHRRDSWPTTMPEGVDKMDYDILQIHHLRLADKLGQPDGPVYEGRSQQAVWITKAEPSEKGDGGTLKSSEGWSIGAKQDVFDKLPVGQPCIVETIQGSRVTGWYVDGQWYGRLTPEGLDREREEFRARWAADKKELLEANRADWAAREAVLPEWIKARIGRFHTEGGKNFELEGWGYELVIAELAVLYDAIPDLKANENGYYPDTPETDAYAEKNGTSGNQHGLAFALAREHHKDPDYNADGTIGGLSPLGAHPLYAPKENA